MKLITFTGPPGSGKDSIIDELLKQINRKAIIASRSIYFSTRKKRPTDRHGKNIYLISKSEFLKKQQQGELISCDISNKDLVGHSIKELYKSSVVLACVSKKNLPELKKIVKQKNGKLFSIYLDVPIKERIIRITKRADSKEKNYVKQKILNGVGFVKKDQRKVFNKVYKNPTGKLKTTVNKIYKDLISTNIWPN